MIDALKIKGIRWPLKFVNGKVATSSGIDHIKQSIIQIIGIGYGEYIMRPYYFSSLPRRVFDPINQTALLNADISEAIGKHEKRVELLNVGVNKSDINQGRLDVEITFTILGIDELAQVSYKK